MSEFEKAFNEYILSTRSKYELTRLEVFQSGFIACQSKLAELEVQVEKLVSVLLSIASPDCPAHSQIKHWESIDHNGCAVVLAHDTKLARQAIKEYEAWKGKL